MPDTAYHPPTTTRTLAPEREYSPSLHEQHAATEARLRAALENLIAETHDAAKELRAVGLYGPAGALWTQVYSARRTMELTR